MSEEKIINEENLKQPENEVKPESNESSEQTNSNTGNVNWYVIKTYSGYENVAKENLQIVIEKYSLQNRIFDIVIPMEDVVEEKNGKRKVVSRKLLPGYILVKMIYGDDIWHAVTRTRGITSFGGPNGRALPMEEEEIRRLKLEKPAVINIDLDANDKVEVIDGPLNGFIGTVIEVDKQKDVCKVMVEMFGRETPVDLALNQIKKID